MQIRALTKADFDYVASVIDRWWGGPSGDRLHPVFFYELGDDALIAEEDGQIIGFLFGFITQSKSPTGYVHLAGIHPEFRRRGVGQALYAKFIERCKEASVGRIKAITTVGHDGSVAFHRALKFTVEEVPDYAGQGRARVVFTKEL